MHMLQPTSTNQMRKDLSYLHQYLLWELTETVLISALIQKKEIDWWVFTTKSLFKCLYIKCGIMGGIVKTLLFIVHILFGTTCKVNSLSTKTVWPIWELLLFVWLSFVFFFNEKALNSQKKNYHQKCVSLLQNIGTFKFKAIQLCNELVYFVYRSRPNFKALVIWLLVNPMKSMWLADTMP